MDVLPEADWLPEISAAKQGDAEAMARLLPLLYEDLKRIARRLMQAQRPGHTLQTTAVVHEAWLRLLAQRQQPEERTYFLSLAATMMRRVLLNHAREQQAGKRGGALAHISLSAAEQVAAGTESLDLIALDQALDALAKLDPRQAKVVEMKFFAGMELEDIAATLNVSLATIKRDWQMARIWLSRALAP